MRLLVFSSLFPLPRSPHHGVFVLERLKWYLAQHPESSAVVIAPVPCVPSFLAKRFYPQFADVTFEDRRDGIRVLHPRFPVIPKVGMSLQPLFMAQAGMRAVRQLQKEGSRFDLVDAHYLYPDAVAAAFVARHLQLPMVVTARGTDVNLIPRYALPRRWIRWMLGRASAGIAVCEALRNAMSPLHDSGLPVRVLGNGVDLEKFQPMQRDHARQRMGWPMDRSIVLSVGHLIERKGHHHLIASVPQMPPSVEVRIIGSGPWRSRLEAQIRAQNLESRVFLHEPLPHAELRYAYAAADVLALLSSREGWPNVLLESMACGTPVLVTKVWGTPEIVSSPEVGVLLDQPLPSSVASGVKELLEQRRPYEAIRRYAEEHSWKRVAKGMQEVFEHVLSRERDLGEDSLSPSHSVVGRSARSH